VPSGLRPLGSPGPRVEAARQAVLDAARNAFGPGPVWQRTQRWMNAARELVEAEAAAEAPTQPDLRPSMPPPPAIIPPPPSAGGPPFPGRSPTRG
jgi:hypothetical protein